MKSNVSGSIALKKEFITPFLASTRSVLTTMANLELTAQAPTKAKSNKPQGDVASIIPMEANDIVGQLVISFEDKTLFNIAYNMLMETYTDINDEVIDVAGEITNMIAGASKALIEKNYDFSMDRPYGVVKAGYTGLNLSSPIQIKVPFRSSAGPFWVEMGFVYKEPTQLAANET